MKSTEGSAAYFTLPHDGHHVCACSIFITRLLSLELFQELHGVRTPLDASITCHDRWSDLADSLAALTTPAELLCYVGRAAAADDQEISFGILVLGRGETPQIARQRCDASSRSVWLAMTSILDFAEFAWMEDRTALSRLVRRVRESTGVEFRRRRKNIELSTGSDARRPLGFRRVADADGIESAAFDATPSDPNSVRHLFPWMPSDDPWWRLLEALFAAEDSPLLVTHIRGMRQAPSASLEEAHDQLARCSGVLDPGVLAEVSQSALERVALLEGPVLAARVFLLGATRPDPALVATVESLIDDPTVRIDSTGANALFRSGTVLTSCSGKEALQALEEPPLELLFGAREAAAFLRTPVPAHDDLPGMPMKRARTARITGQSGGDSPLGLNVHGSTRTEVALDEGMRTRHAYVVGQTGTGKSTLLLHMVLHDIARGRGVCVLDPHGTLIQEVLEHYPDERVEDLMIFDVEDVGRPLGFNVLRIEADHADDYCAKRDLVIDELYTYLDHAYDLNRTGGPIFETYFRGILRLLLGEQSPQEPLIPNLSLFRAAFTNAALREGLKRVGAEGDPVLSDFLQEARRAGGDASLPNLAPYVTSKLNRFTFDTTLRNVFCQRTVLDFARIVRERKVILCHTARGRVGDYPAGLLAGQMLSGLRRAVMQRGVGVESEPFCLYADEFQLFATPRFGELLAEARKFGLAITIAHQFAAQLDPQVLSAVLGNAGTVVALRLGAEDAAKLEPVMLPVFSSRDLLSMPNFRACVRSFGSLGYTPFSVELHPPPSERNLEQAEALRARSRAMYGKSRHEVETEFRETYAAYMNL